MRGLDRMDVERWRPRRRERRRKLARDIAGLADAGRHHAAGDVEDSGYSSCEILIKRIDQRA